MQAVLISSFTVNIQVEPNGQEITQAQVVLEFDPDHLRFVDAKLNGSSLLRTKLIDGDLRQNHVILAAEQLNSPPDTTFTMGSITFEILPIATTTDLTFVTSGDLRTHASFDGIEVTDDLYDGEVTIGQFTFP
jgi:hypothetical protein